MNKEDNKSMFKKGDTITLPSGTIATSLEDVVCSEAPKDAERREILEKLALDLAKNVVLKTDVDYKYMQGLCLTEEEIAYVNANAQFQMLDIMHNVSKEK